MRRLVIATTNEGKAREIAQVLAGLPFELASLSSYPPVDEPEENADTFAGNAAIKALAAAQHTGEMAIADDSGLVVDALDGAPGIYSSRFAPTDPERVAKILALMESLPDDRRSARFVAAAVIAGPEGVIATVEGACEGAITHEARGENGFGYDPIFQPTGFDRTMAELSADEKNSISHRGRAFRAAREVLEQMAGE